MVKVGLSVISRWHEVLLGEKFFGSCLVHEFEKKSAKNTFCLDCCTSLCPHCLPPHQSHCLLQIRRYVYQDVIRLSDAQKLMDCSSVQPYTTNSAKVVFLNQRPMTRQFKWSGNACIVCDRTLQDPYLLCSLSCKVHQMSSGNLGLTKQHFYDSEMKELEGSQMTPDSVLELPISLLTLPGSSSSSVGPVNFTESTLTCTTTTEFVRKKRSIGPVFRNRYRPLCASATKFVYAISRRKGIPHRSPLY